MTVRELLVKIFYIHHRQMTLDLKRPMTNFELRIVYGRDLLLKIKDVKVNKAENYVEIKVEEEENEIT